MFLENPHYVIEQACGTGVPNRDWVRRNIIESQASDSETARDLRLSVSTVRRVRQRWLREGNLRVGRIDVHPSERRSTLTPRDCQVLAQFICIYPQVTLVQLQQFLLIGLRVALSTSTICRELKRLGFSRKQINRYSIYRRESDRLSWWTNPPSQNGCYGVPVDNLIDVDESKFTWESAERKYGYSFKGFRAKASGLVSITHLGCHDQLTFTSQPPTSGKAWNVILAISGGTGVVAYWIFEGTTNEAVFQIFLSCMLFPALADGGSKVIMWDNLSSHLTKSVRENVLSAGHMCISRPTHSPDFAPVENCFGEMDQKLRAQEGSLNISTFPASIANVAASITLANIRSYFGHCYYRVPEIPFKRYNGEQ